MIVTLDIPLINWDENDMDAFMESVPLWVRIAVVILIGSLVAWYLFNGTE